MNDEASCDGQAVYGTWTKLFQHIVSFKFKCMFIRYNLFPKLVMTQSTHDMDHQFFNVTIFMQYLMILNNWIIYIYVRFMVAYTLFEGTLSRIICEYAQHFVTYLVSHSVESPSMVDPQWNIWYWGSKWNLQTVGWDAVGCEWGTTSVYFGITYICFVPCRLPVFVVEPPYRHRDFFIFVKSINWRRHTKFSKNVMLV